MRYALAWLFVFGCSDDAAKFVGTWSYYDSTVTTACNPGGGTQQLVGTIQLTRAGDQIQIDSASQYTIAVAVSGDCRPRFSVTDMQATLVPQDTCYLAAGDGTQLRLNYATYIFTLADITGPGIAPMTPGLTMTLDATVASQNGSCQVTSDGTLVTSG
jgi:hypothetical protein